jgi:hypothetical protein
MKVDSLENWSRISLDVVTDVLAVRIDLKAFVGEDVAKAFP